MAMDERSETHRGTAERSETHRGTAERAETSRGTAEPAGAPPAEPAEGVRIIAPEEAAALEHERAAARPEARRADAPGSSPAGARPVHRFPLPASVPAAAVPRAPLAGPVSPSAAGGEGEGGPAGAEAPAKLLHWTERATGEVPRILAPGPAEADDAAGADDDMAAWNLSSGGPRWRDQRADWEDPDFGDGAMLADESTRVGALDSSRSDHSDLFDFDDHDAAEDAAAEDAAAEEEDGGGGDRAPRRARAWARGRGPGGAGPSGGELRTRLLTGVGFATLGALAFRLGPAWSALVFTVVVAMSVAELYDALRRGGHRPATLVGMVATVGLMLAAYWRGEAAIPLVIVLTVACGLFWYLFGVARGEPAADVGVTVLGVAWVGLFGSFATLLLRIPEREGVSFLLGAVLVTAAHDIGSLVAGRRFGRTALSPQVSPSKTWEGWLGGTVAALLTAFVLSLLNTVWDPGPALLLALVAAVVAPLGDLCESLVKRDLGVKDMSSVLPGHGGLLDRFDALLFVLPATYYLVRVLDLA